MNVIPGRSAQYLKMVRALAFHSIYELMKICYSKFEILFTRIWFIKMSSPMQTNSTARHFCDKCFVSFVSLRIVSKLKLKPQIRFECCSLFFPSFCIKFNRKVPFFLVPAATNVVAFRFKTWNSIRARTHTNATMWENIFATNKLLCGT